MMSPEHRLLRSYGELALTAAEHNQAVQCLERDNHMGIQRVLVDCGLGTQIWVEATPIRDGLDQDVSASEALHALSLLPVVDAIRAIGHAVTTAIETSRPDNLTVEFALDVGIESGKLTALWVKGTGKANLKISLGWTKSSTVKGLTGSDAGPS